MKTEETNISAELRTLWVGKDISTSTTSTSDDYILAKSVGSAIPIWSKSGGLLYNDSVAASGRRYDAAVL